MNNFNFVHYPSQSKAINLNTISFFYKDDHKFPDGHVIYYIWFDDDGKIPCWYWKIKEDRDIAFNALLKLTSQNLCNEASLSSDSPQTCPTTPKQSIEKHPPHRETNPS